MNMRVSTLQMNSTGVGGIQRLQSELYSLQNQVNTGRKIVTPKDDPVASAQVLLVSQSKEVNAQYITNQEAASTKLSALDDTLSGVNDELLNIYDKALAAGNGSYSNSDRAAIAAELSERLKSLVSLANTQDGTGRYVFGGMQSTSAPFQLSGNAPSATNPGYALTVVAPAVTANPYVNYNGDDGLQKLQVGASTFVDTNLPGSEVFMRIRDGSGNATGRSVFDAVQNMVNFLNTPATTATASDATYTMALSDISAAMDTVSRSRATVGARLSSLDSMAVTSGDRKLQYESHLSTLRDLDYAEALTAVSQQKLQLDAAQATYAATAKLSLFDYI